MNQKFEELRERLDALIGRKASLKASREALVEDQANAQDQAEAIAEQKRINDERLLKLKESGQQLAEADTELTAELGYLLTDLALHTEGVQQDREEEDRDLQALAEDVVRRIPVTEPPARPAKKDAKRKKK